MEPLILTLYTSHHVTVKRYRSRQQPFVSANNVIYFLIPTSTENNFNYSEQGTTSFLRKKSLFK